MSNINVANPVGLAAGFDKDYRMGSSLATLGFGYIVGGTVLLRPREGNPKPRLVRDKSIGALTNSLGFPSLGLEKIVRNLKSVDADTTKFITSISGLSTEEFLTCYSELQPLSAGIELNISSPNTEGIRVFQQIDHLKELLISLNTMKTKPLFIKLPPYFNQDEKNHTHRMIDICLEYSIDGLTLSNTRPVTDDRLAVGKGGLSGKPLLSHTIRIVQEIRANYGQDITINACGGISSGDNALDLIAAGADTIQLYTGFIYEGPSIAKYINNHILLFMEKHGLTSLQELREMTGRRQ